MAAPAALIPPEAIYQEAQKQESTKGQERV
jgi:hypothetical protein